MCPQPAATVSGHRDATTAAGPPAAATAAAAVEGGSCRLIEARAVAVERAGRLIIGVRGLERVVEGAESEARAAVGPPLAAPPLGCSCGTLAGALAAARPYSRPHLPRVRAVLLLTPLLVPSLAARPSASPRSPAALATHGAPLLRPARSPAAR